MKISTFKQNGFRKNGEILKLDAKISNKDTGPQRNDPEPNQTVNIFLYSRIDYKSMKSIPDTNKLML